MCSGQVCKSFGDIHEKFTVLAEQNAACPFIYARRATKVEGNKCRTKAKELLRAFCPNIHTMISYFIRWERRLPSSGLLLNTTTGFGSLVGIVFPKAIKTGIILLIDQAAAIIFVK